MLAASAHQPVMTSMGKHMLECEARDGRAPIWPHSAPAWLRPQDWIGWPVLSIANGELHIVAVLSAGLGGLTRLIQGARAAGLSPVIVEPMGVMPGVLRRWGWQCTVIGDGWDRREEWRPSC